MPAIDRYQGVVINALRKAGWQVNNTPYLIRIDKRSIFIDLTAQRIDEDEQQQIVILGVKSFESQSAVHHLEEAVGQYVIYRALLEEIGVPYPLYLTVPSAAFEGVLILQPRISGYNGAMRTCDGDTRWTSRPTQNCISKNGID